jgi:thioredoxin 1
VLALTDETFEGFVSASERPVLVDFGAPWCRPCESVDRLLAALEPEHGDRIVFAKVDIEASPSCAARYGVLSIPTVILFERGEPLETVIGAKPRQRFERLLARIE